MAMFTADGSLIHADLTVDDKTLLVQIDGLMRSIGDRMDDPAVSVINRDAYRDDAFANVEYQEMIDAQRTQDRTADLAILEVVTGDTPVLDIDGARALLRAINGARLALGARHGAFEEGVSWEMRIGDDPGLAAVAWLGYVQSELLGAISLLERADG